MTFRDFNLDDFLPYKVAVLSARMNRLLSQVYNEPHGLSTPEWRVLVHVARREKMSVRDIHKCVNLEKPAVSRAVAKLEAAGFLEKAVNELDHRLVEIRLTDRGVGVLDKVTPNALLFEDDLLNGLSEEDRNQLDLLMERLHHQLDKHPDATPRKPRADGQPRPLID